jgi:hypothetical protein
LKKENGEPHNSHLHHTLLLHLHQPKKAVRNREVRREIESTRRRFTSFVFILFVRVFCVFVQEKKEREISFRFPSFTNRIVCFSSSFFSVVVVVALCSLSLSLSLRTTSERRCKKENDRVVVVVVVVDDDDEHFF